jgi:hypothetical protein
MIFLPSYNLLLVQRIYLPSKTGIESSRVMKFVFKFYSLKVRASSSLSLLSFLNEKIEKNLFGIRKKKLLTFLRREMNK